MTIYIINKNFSFDSERCLLRNQEQGMDVTLHATAASCFTFLLEQHGNIVPKEDIFAAVWHNYGLTITDNSYYQTVLHLRRQLEKAGLSSDTIKTIPRKGLLVPSTIDVTLSQETPVLQPEEKEQEVLIHEQAPLSEATVAQNPDTVTEAPASSLPAQLNTLQRPALWRIPSSGLLMLVCLASMASCLFFIINKFATDAVSWNWSEYQPIGNDAGCHLFYQGSVAKAEILDNLTPKFRQACKKYPYSYITKYNAIKRESIIMCQRRIDAVENNCVSYYGITQ